jgi:hypothetical protein
MTYEPRLFASDAAIRRVGEGLLSRTLPRAEWTHEAHLAACLWLLRERPDIDAPAELPAIIAGYNEAVGGRNSDTEGYHETITQAYIRLIRAYLAMSDRDQPLVDLVNALLVSPLGHREALLAHYSRERLFSVAARKHWVEPDLAPFPSQPAGADTTPTLV